MTLDWKRLGGDDSLAAIDERFGRFLEDRARAGGADDAEAAVLGLSGALVSRERNRGHVCVALEAWSEQPFADESTADPIRLPDRASWRATLQASPLCGDGSSPTPLVLDAGERLYLYRDRDAERRIADHLRRRALDTGSPLTIGPDRFRELFPDAADEIDWQAIAACVALRRRLTVVLGGPGTGKTYTVARMLALLLDGRPDWRVALAAPTGKAAARLEETIGEQLTAVGITDREFTPQTLHRLLGYLPSVDRFRRNAARPLTEDIVVVDEASMIDLGLMAQLLDAVRPDARLILLGDPDQLTSVANGQVLGDLRAAAGDTDRVPVETAVALQQHGAVAPATTTATTLGPCVVRLHRSRRFSADRGIGLLAAAVLAGDPTAAAAALASGDDEVQRREPPQRNDDPVRALGPALDWIGAVYDAVDGPSALDALDAGQILCAIRHGPQGVEGLNRLVESWLSTTGRVTPGSGAFYPRRPVLITANDPQLDLFNGDIGLTSVDESGVRVLFRTGDDVRSFAPSRLPPHETAWATTVHKAQGSEYDAVLLVLPDRDTPVATRELVYTGVTRARLRVIVAATEAALTRAVTRRTERASGLPDLL